MKNATDVRAVVKFKPFKLSNGLPISIQRNFVYFQKIFILCMDKFNIIDIQIKSLESRVYTIFFRVVKNCFILYINNISHIYI